VCLSNWSNCTGEDQSEVSAFFCFAVHYYSFLLSLKDFTIFFVSHFLGWTFMPLVNYRFFSLFMVYIVYVILLFLGRESYITKNRIEKLSRLLLTLYITPRELMIPYWRYASIIHATVVHVPILSLTSDIVLHHSSIDYLCILFNWSMLLLKYSI
jgi:hypothetical protein